MSRRELLIVLAHTQFCDACRQRLLNSPQTVLVGRMLSEEEKALLSGLEPDDFATPERLAASGGCTTGELDDYRDHPVARLRHL